MKLANQIRRYINANFIENNVKLVNEMQRYNKTYGRIDNSLKRAKLITKLYIQYAILSREPFEVKQIESGRLKYPESSLSQNFETEDMLNKIEKADIIVFDAWNVLFYPSLNENQLLSLFEVIAGHPGISECKDIEKMLSEEESKLLDEIKADFTFENEYLHMVWKMAEKMKKTVLIRNNSVYHTERELKLLMKKYSYHGEIYTCRQGSKLFITRDLDNVEKIKYIDVNILGDKYRPYLYSNAVTALYNQIVNLNLHDRKTGKSLFYEYGLTCGGILTCGFCQYLNAIAKREKIDKFIFVARDGDIIRKIYDKFYREQESSYLVFSRFASYEIVFEDYPEEYLDKNIKARIFRKNSDNSIKKILQECKLEFLEAYLYERNLRAEDILDVNNYEGLRKVFLNHKVEIQNSFQETCNAAKQYILQHVKNFNKVCVVDLGWHGKSIIYLKHLLENSYKWDGKVLGAMVGAAGDEVTQNYVRSGIINPYAFENEYWRRTGCKNGEYMSENEIICIEALFSSEADTLLRYQYGKDGKVEFIYGKSNKNKENIQQVHEGIMDFAEQFVPVLNKYHLKITSRDAYTPLDFAMQNKKYLNMIYEKYYEVPNAINGF